MMRPVHAERKTTFIKNSFLPLLANWGIPYIEKVTILNGMEAEVKMVFWYSKYENK